MRKFIASIILCAVILGTFMPFSFSADGVQGNVASAQIATTPATPSIDPLTGAPVINVPAITGNANPAQPVTSSVNTPTTEQESGATNLLDCKFYDIFCGVYKLVITFILFIPNTIAVIAGLLMDLSLYMSINPGVYGASGGALESGLRGAWTMVRDFANIGFIFALFVAAFSLIVGKDLMGFKPKDTVVRVIMMALLVNFSFFMCRVIIQFADVFSHFLYNKVTVETTSAPAGIGSLSVEKLLTGSGAKTPSLAIISKVGPQQAFVGSGLATEKSFGESLYETVTAPSSITTALGGPTGQLVTAWWKMGKGWDFYVQYGIMAVVSFFIYLILIYAFVSVAFIFLGRIFGLWLGMIVSPLAFVSYAIPALADNEFIGFEKWLNNFVQLAFLTPIFIFFLYLTSVIFQLDKIMPATLASGGLVSVLLRELLPAIGATFLLLKGKKIATDMAGEIGKMAGKLSGWATTAALGAATGGTAMLARQTVGRGGAMLANSMKGDNSAVGKGLRNIGTSLGAASFDVRKSEYAMKGLSKFTAAAGEPVDLGTRGMREGGYLAEGDPKEIWRKRQERIAKEVEEKKKKEAEDAKLNAQAEEAKKLRETEAKIARNKQAKENEEMRIAAETGSQKTDTKMDKLIGKEQQTIIANQKELGLIQSQILKINMDENAQKIPLKKEKDAIDAERQKIGNVSIGDPEYTKVVDLENRKKALEEQERNITETATTARTKLNERKDPFERKIEELNQKVSKFTAMKGKTIDQARHENEVRKIEAKDSDEGKAIAATEKKVEEANKKLRDLQEKKKQAQKDGDQAKLNELNKDIKEQKTKIEKIQNEELSPAKKRLEARFGTKAMEDALKEAEKEYKESQKGRLTMFEETANRLDIQITKDKYALDSKNKEFQKIYATSLEKDAQFNQSIAGDWAEKIGTISGGRVMGGSVAGANENAAGAVRKAVTEPEKKTPQKPEKNTKDFKKANSESDKKEEKKPEKTDISGDKTK